MQRILALLGVIGISVFVFFFVGSAPRVEPAWGMTLSTQYARFLGEDPVEVAQAMTDDLSPAVVRLPIYWNDVEKVPGVYDFSEFDGVMHVFADRQTPVILAVGYKVPRWPECHPPEWAKKTSDEEFDRVVINFVKETVRHYQRYSNITMWQIENEPMLQFFGPCSRFTVKRLEQEIAEVRGLDRRPILMTDSGELSSWLPISHFGDVLGVTMYREVHNPLLGYMTYPLRPIFYYRKALLVHALNHGKPVFGAELQMEPWAPQGDVRTLTPQEIEKSWSVGLMKQHLEYAQKTGFPLHLLWGVEYWYYLKEQGNSSAWDFVKSLDMGYTSGI